MTEKTNYRNNYIQIDKKYYRERTLYKYSSMLTNSERLALAKNGICLNVIHSAKDFSFGQAMKLNFANRFEWRSAAIINMIGLLAAVAI